MQKVQIMYVWASYLREIDSKDSNNTDYDLAIEDEKLDVESGPAQSAKDTTKEFVSHS